MNVMGARPVVVIGAGGHAKVAVSTLMAAGFTVLALYDDDVSRQAQSILGIPVRGPVSEARGIGWRTIVALGDNDIRQAVVARLKNDWATAVHPQAFVEPSASLGEGTLVFAGAVIQPCATLGRHCIANTGVRIDHDVQIGDFAHIAPGAVLTGSVVVRDRVLVGAGAVVTPGREIGAGAIVGAGAVVVDDVPADAVVRGVPAQIARMRQGWSA